MHNFRFAPAIFPAIGIVMRCWTLCVTKIRNVVISLRSLVINLHTSAKFCHYDKSFRNYFGFCVANGSKTNNMGIMYIFRCFDFSLASIYFQNLATARRKMYPADEQFDTVWSNSCDIMIKPNIDRQRIYSKTPIFTVSIFHILCIFD